jgi:hypothetical protein
VTDEEKAEVEKLNAQIKDLQGQLAKATTPKQEEKIESKLEARVAKLEDLLANLEEDAQPETPPAAKVEATPTVEKKPAVPKVEKKKGFWDGGGFF